MARPSPERITLPYFWNQLNTDGSVTTGSYIPNGTTIPYRYERTWTGTVTPGWHSMKRRSKMKIAALTHTYRVREATGSPYRETILQWNISGQPLASQVKNVSNAAFISSMPSATHLGDAYTKARARLAEKVNNMDVNLAQAFGERKQTANLLANTAVRIAAAMRHLKHGELRDFSRALSLEGNKIPSARQWDRVIATPVDKRLSSHWLSYQYGWKPLIQDAFGVATLLAQHSQERYVTRSESSATVKQSGMIPFNPVTGAAEVIYSYRTRVRMASSYRCDDLTKTVLAQTGISNPALLAWELLPWSFVIDWFIPVGNYLQALNEFAGFTFVQGWYSQKSNVTWQQTHGTKNRVWGGSSYNQIVQQGSSLWSDTLYERFILNSFPAVGSLSFKNPIGGEPLARFATAAALMRQLVR